MWGWMLMGVLASQPAATEVTGLELHCVRGPDDLAAWTAVEGAVAELLDRGVPAAHMRLSCQGVTRGEVDAEGWTPSCEEALEQRIAGVLAARGLPKAPWRVRGSQQPVTSTVLANWMVDGRQARRLRPSDVYATCSETSAEASYRVVGLMVVSAPGRVGPQGERGPEGRQGLVGPRGDKGLQGLPGPRFFAAGRVLSRAGEPAMLAGAGIAIGLATPRLELDVAAHLLRGLRDSRWGPELQLRLALPAAAWWGATPLLGASIAWLGGDNSRPGLSRYAARAGMRWTLWREGHWELLLPLTGGFAWDHSRRSRIRGARSRSEDHHRFGGDAELSLEFRWQ